MEELLTQLNAAKVGDAADDTSHSFLYKNWGRDDGQEGRRQSLLASQKKGRDGCLDRSRGIIGIVEAVNMDMEWSNSKKTGYKPSSHIPGFHQKRLSYRNMLMLSEWMIERPVDLETNWFITSCPKGTRCLVVAYKGMTKAFNKFGSHMFSFRSRLHGGYPQGKGNKTGNICCVLDCIYSDEVEKFYVLDLLTWNNQTMTDCDTEFRHYWLVTQFEENKLLSIANQNNEIPFELLPKLLCTKDNLNLVLSEYPAFPGHIPVLDGFLFYHRETHYTSGYTPLVGWLFPYMVDEIISSDITINQSYRLQKPKDYTNQKEFISKFEEMQAKKKLTRKSRPHSANTGNATEMQTLDDTEPQTEQMDAIAIQDGNVKEIESDQVDDLSQSYVDNICDQNEMVVSNGSDQNQIVTDTVCDDR